MRQISRGMEMIHPTIGWRRDEHGTHKHAHGSWILWSVSRACSKTMHSLSCITSGLSYITLCYIDSIFFLPLEQSRTALLGCRLVFARLLAGNKSTRNVTKYSLKGPCVLLFCKVKLFTLDFDKQHQPTLANYMSTTHQWEIQNWTFQTPANYYFPTF